MDSGSKRPRLYAKGLLTYEDDDSDESAGPMHGLPFTIPSTMKMQWPSAWSEGEEEPAEEEEEEEEEEDMEMCEEGAGVRIERRSWRSSTSPPRKSQSIQHEQ